MLNNSTKILAGLLVLFMCNCKMQSNEPQKRRPVTEEDLILANRQLVGRDAAAIKDYVELNELNMIETLTGMWYQIDEDGSGRLAKKNDIVEIAYDIYLLDGTPCYSSDKLGNKSFKIGQGGVESGLEEGILLLKVGSKATFIMPPHRAYGLVGDDDKIPGRTTILYKVEVISLNK